MPTPTRRHTTSLRIERLESREAPAVDLRVVSYNVAAADVTLRAGLGGIVQWIGNQPAGGVTRPIDILLIQETDSNSSGSGTTAGVQTILNNLYGAGMYARGTLNGGSSGGGTQGVVYRTGTVDLVGEVAVGTLSSNGAARLPIRYQFRPDGFAPGEADFYLYNAHMKANDTDPDEDRRRVEAGQIRVNADAFPAADLIYAGDFNVYNSIAGGAYQRFFDAGNGRAIDPANPARNWANNSSAWVALYTQAPLQSPPSGLVGGGLDDRFDYQLMSEDLSSGTPAGLEYRPGTYRVFGNNGSVPVNGNVNSTANTALNFIVDVPTRNAIRNSLGTFTDHLPVVADYFVATGRMQFGVSSYTVNELAGTATITVSRVGGSTGTATVNYAATAGTAAAGVNFTPAAGTLTFGHGVTSQTFTVPILNDNAAGGNKTVNLALSLPASSPADLGSPSTATLTIQDVGAPPAVELVSVNAGQADPVQRSRVTNLQVAFSAALDTTAGVGLASAFALSRVGGGVVGAVSAVFATVSGKTVATLTFTGANTEAGSLADGVWQLTIDRTKVRTLTGQPMLADYTSPTSGAGRIFRLYGDLDGNAQVNGQDAGFFDRAFGSVSGQPAFVAAFDWNDDGQLNGQDAGLFDRHFGQTL